MKYILFALFLLAAVYVAGLIKKEDKKETSTPSYLKDLKKKAFVFDNANEFTMHKILTDLFSDRYYIFPQLAYSKLMELKNGSNKFGRTKFDKKSVDFVLCEKEHAMAKLAIELDGSSHNSQSAQNKDREKDQMFEAIGLPLLRIKTENLNSEFIKQEVEKVLN